mmetsp:Transcript_75254/g.220625  ORF Transcript_75254/g.220625 Transcript_75254/m.220625 type:complete len:222 (+) Transcript_75254:610-1275(+)
MERFAWRSLDPANSASAKLTAIRSISPVAAADSSRASSAASSGTPAARSSARARPRLLPESLRSDSVRPLAGSGSPPFAASSAPAASAAAEPVAEPLPSGGTSSTSMPWERSSPTPSRARETWKPRLARTSCRKGGGADGIVKLVLARSKWVMISPCRSFAHTSSSSMSVGVVWCQVKLAPVVSDTQLPEQRLQIITPFMAWLLSGNRGSKKLLAMPSLSE